jgi:hypothetical protein
MEKKNNKIAFVSDTMQFQNSNSKNGYPQLFGQK